MKNLITRFLHEEDGATMVEYAILASLVSIAAIVVIALVGDDVLSLFQQAEGAMDTGGM